MDITLTNERLKQLVQMRVNNALRLQLRKDVHVLLQKACIEKRRNIKGRFVSYFRKNLIDGCEIEGCKVPIHNEDDEFVKFASVELELHYDENHVMQWNLSHAVFSM